MKGNKYIYEATTSIKRSDPERVAKCYVYIQCTIYKRMAYVISLKYDQRFCSIIYLKKNEIIEFNEHLDL